jgi:hypothetical protein
VYTRYFLSSMSDLLTSLVYLISTFFVSTFLLISTLLYLAGGG